MKYHVTRSDRVSEDTLTDDVDLTDDGTYQKLIEENDSPVEGEATSDEVGSMVLRTLLCGGVVL